MAGAVSGIVECEGCGSVDLKTDWVDEFRSCSLEAVYLYFPSRRHQSAALRAFVAFLKTADFGDASR